MGVLLLVRHGQASFGSDDYDVLSETGWEQGRVLGQWLAKEGPEPVSVVHGGMRRHRETWEAMASALSGPPTAEVDENWAEFDHLGVLARYAEATGAVVDHTTDRRAFQEQFEISTAHWSAAGPDGGYPEPYDAFVGRARTALSAAAERPGPTLVVTSGGVIAALAALLVVPDISAVGPVWARFNTVVANTSVTRVIVGATGARLLTFNEHPHLPRSLVTYR
ncbi:histidine phosphatase family protein [Nocardioides sp. SLBN-35]|uniref:histidine phosphatase family protein n=1 Tax=Nocardioides sp. SLBN-35 TaxID=2768445 RepID=UPI00114EE28D|nr:histidine phosphatase family protein [Nocardioides sp. SLBN-35]TQK68441.1 broad specificity phosphatase PhoE [Nocardioides sp. SLBN-35]